MKKCFLSLIFFLLCSKVLAYKEYPVDFTISTSESDMSFVITSTTNNKVSLSGDSEYDDGDMDYYPAINLKLGDIPYNLVVPQTVTNGTTTYSVVEIAFGAFGNGSRTSTDKVTVHYNSLTNGNSIYSLVLPSSITTINSMPTNIKILKCCASTPPALNKAIPSTCQIIYVPLSSLSAYKSAAGWSNYSDKIVGYSSNSNLISNISFSSKVYETNIATPVQLSPTVTPNSSSSNITWSCSDPSIATVNSSGLVTGVSPGTCYITATSSDGGYVFSTIKFTINSTPPISNITLNETAVTLYTGDVKNKATLTPTISPSESTGVGVTWSSSNSGVASVDQNGVVTAVAKGTATITCIANDESGITASCQITVDELSSIRIGTETNSTNNAPFHSSTSINEVFMRYKYNDIGIAGNLHAISFDENWTNGYVRNIGVEIWMGRKDDTFYSDTGAQTVNLMLNGMTRVYQGVITIEPNNNGSKRLRTIVLDTPFYYDGSYDLDIFVATTFNSISTSLKYDYTTTPYTSSNPNTVKYRTLDDNLYSQWTTSRQRPNIQMWFDDIIIVKDINSSDISISSINAVIYNGSAQMPAITVKDGTTTLTSGIDYTVAYSNNTNAGTATVTITGMGNYTGTKSANFTINPKNASNLTINSISAVTYTGSARTPSVTVKDGTTTLTSGYDYTRVYSNNTNAGTATVTITGMGNYTGTKSANFTINPKNASNLTINSIAAVTYNGSAQTPTVTVKDGSTTLTNGTHYTIAYSNNINAGTATGTITGKGNYTGTKSANFTINKAPLTITAKSYTINQKDDLPTFEVTYDGFKNAQTSSVLTTLPTITCDAADSETAGDFEITPSGAAATNYSFNYVSGTLTIDEVTSVSITLNSLGKGTYCSKFPLDFTNVSGIYAYIICGFKPSAGNLSTLRVYEVPEETGLYVVGTPGSTYNIPVAPTDFYYTSMMKGITVATVIPANEDGYTNYVLASNGNGGVFFKRANNNSSPANRAYVQIPSSTAGAREFLGIELDDDSTTGLDGVITSDTEEAEGDYYNLSGQKVQTPRRGIYIKNGKKIIIH